MSSRRSLLATPTSSLFTTSVHNPLNYNMPTSILIHLNLYWQYFETLNNLYLVTDLCQGGELFDRICAKGQYYERDARHLVKVVLNAVEYLHSHGIVHRGESPLDLLLRSYLAQPPGNPFIKTVIENNLKRACSYWCAPADHSNNRPETREFVIPWSRRYIGFVNSRFRIITSHWRFKIQCIDYHLWNPRYESSCQ